MGTDDRGERSHACPSHAAVTIVDGDGPTIVSLQGLPGHQQMRRALLAILHART